MDFIKLFNQFKEQNIYGRYIHLDHIEPLLKHQNRKDNVSVVGNSVQGKPIYKYQIGSGEVKILFWSQMHGNESTTTKALFDLFNFLEKSESSYNFLKKFTFCFLPILNPDGAKLYTRANANGIDLNRDAANLSQPESKVLRLVYDTFKPDYCYNLHDQRTIFGVGNTGKSATVSFLSPSYNQERAINDTRLKAIRVINAMNECLQQYIPGQIGRFDDGFNINCIGDTFQNLGTPTVLFEAGHYPDDYQREETRKYIFIAMLASFNHINENDIVNNEISDYLNIPQNNPNFYDFVYKNIKINYDSSEKIINFAAQIREDLLNNSIVFNAFISKIENLEDYFGHLTIDGKGKKYSDESENIPKLNHKADFYLDNEIKIVNGMIIF